MMSQWLLGVEYTAVFDPERKDDLQHESIKYVGKRVTVTYDGRRDYGQFKGRESFYIIPPKGEYIGWAPIEDFKDIKLSPKTNEESK